MRVKLEQCAPQSNTIENNQIKKNIEKEKRPWEGRKAKMNWFLAHHYGGYCRHCIVLCCDRRRTSSARRHTFFLFSVCRMAGGLQLQTRAGYGGFSGVQTPSNKKKQKDGNHNYFLIMCQIWIAGVLSPHTHSVTVAQIQMCNNAANVTVISVLRCVAAHVKWPPISCGCWCRRIIIGLSNGLFAVNLRCCQMISRDCTEMRWMEMIYY